MVHKKDSGQRPVINLNKMESLHTVKFLLQKGDLMTKIDLKDTFFMVLIAQPFHHLLLFRVNAESFQFLCLRAMHCPESVHKGPQISHKATEHHGHQTSDLHGRHVTHGPFETPHSRTYLYSSLPPGESGVCNQQQKIHTNPLSTNRVSGNDCEFTIHGIKTSRRENKEGLGLGLGSELKLDIFWPPQISLLNH